MAEAIFVKFSQLILMKIIKIVATRCQILKMYHIQFPDPVGEWGTLHRSPNSLAGFKEPTSKGREGKGGEREGSPLLFLWIYAHGRLPATFVRGCALLDQELNFLAIFLRQFATVYLSHPLTSVQNFTEIAQGTTPPSRR